MIGTCIWFGPDIPWGYVGHGIYTNNAYEFQVYVHYKNMVSENLRNPKFKELKPNDIVEFEVGEGYNNNGTQALNIKIIKYAESQVRIGAINEVNQ